MSINDPILIEVWHDLFILKQGRETFYDELCHMITFDTIEDAIDWSMEHLNEIPLLDR